jgi:hypothetical protein
MFFGQILNPIAGALSAIRGAQIEGENYKPAALAETLKFLLLLSF